MSNILESTIDVTVVSGGASSQSFKTIAVSGQSDVVADSSTDTLTLVAGSNITLTTNAGTDTITIAASGGATDSFKTIAVAGQSDVVADSATDTLTLVAGSNVTITTNAGTDTITIASTGGGDAYSIAYSATVTPVLSSGVLLNVGTLTGNVTIANPTGTPVDGQRLTIRLNQDGTGGRTMSFDTSYEFSSIGDVTASDLSTVPNAKNRIAFQYNSVTSKWEAVGLVRL